MYIVCLVTCVLFSITRYFIIYHIQIDGPLDIIVTSVLKLLDNDVTDNWKTCAEYFQLLKIYANHVNDTSL